MFSSTEINNTLCTISTAGNGDCAFHASLGEWDSHKQHYYCENIVSKREVLAQAILRSSPEDKIFQIVQDSIKARIMEEQDIKRETGENIKKLRENYRHYIVENNEKARIIWRDLQEKLEHNIEIMTFIAVETKPSLTTVNEKFHYCYNKNEEKMRTLLSLFPELLILYDEYNELTKKDGFDWQQLEDKKIIYEYVDTHIRKEGEWFLPNEIQLIAYAFDITIEYCLRKEDEDQETKIHEPQSIMEIFNPGKNNKVIICFNNRDHYERVVARTAYEKIYRHHIDPASASHGGCSENISLLTQHFLKTSQNELNDYLQQDRDLELITEPGKAKRHLEESRECNSQERKKQKIQEEQVTREGGAVYLQEEIHTSKQKIKYRKLSLFSHPLLLAEKIIKITKKMISIRNKIEKKESYYVEYAKFYNLYACHTKDEGNKEQKINNEVLFKSKGDDSTKCIKKIEDEDEKSIIIYLEKFESLLIEIKKLNKQYSKYCEDIYRYCDDMVQNIFHEVPLPSSESISTQKLEGSFQHSFNLPDHESVVIKVPEMQIGSAILNMIIPNESFLMHIDEYSCSFAQKFIIGKVLKSPHTFGQVDFEEMLDKIFSILNDKIIFHSNLLRDEEKIQGKEVEVAYIRYYKEMSERLSLIIKTNEENICLYLIILLAITKAAPEEVLKYHSHKGDIKGSFMQCITGCGLGHRISSKVKKFFIFFLKKNLLTIHNLTAGIDSKSSIFHIAIRFELVPLLELFSQHEKMREILKRNQSMLVKIVDYIKLKIKKIEKDTLSLKHEFERTAIDKDLDTMTTRNTDHGCTGDKFQLLDVNTKKKYLYKLVNAYETYSNIRFYCTLLKMLSNLNEDIYYFKDAEPLFLCHYIANNFRQSVASGQDKTFISAYKEILLKAIEQEKESLLSEFIDSSFSLRSKGDSYHYDLLLWSQSLKVIYRSKQDEYIYTEKDTHSQHRKTVIIPGESIHYQLRQSINDVARKYQCSIKSDINYLAGALTFVYSRMLINTGPIELFKSNRGERNYVTFHLNLPAQEVVNYRPKSPEISFFKYRNNAHACMMIRRAMLAGMSAEDIFQLITAPEWKNLNENLFGLENGVAWHSEALLFDFLSQENTLDKILYRLKEQLKKNNGPEYEPFNEFDLWEQGGYKIYAVILDLHSNHYSCNGCTPQLYGFQFNEAVLSNQYDSKQHDITKGFLFNLKAALMRHGFAVSKNKGICMATRYTAQQPCSGVKRKSKANHLSGDQKLPEMNGRFFKAATNSKDKDFPHNTCIISRDTNSIPLKKEKNDDTFLTLFPTPLQATVFGSNRQKIESKEGNFKLN